MGKLERVLGLLSRKELLELLAKKLGVPEAEQQQMRNEIERAPNKVQALVHRRR